MKAGEHCVARAACTVAVYHTAGSKFNLEDFHAGSGFFTIRCTEAGQFELQTLFSARHSPSMIRREYRLEQKGQRAQQRFVGANLPVVRYVHVWAVLFEGPDAAPVEITPRFKAEAM